MSYLRNPLLRNRMLPVDIVKQTPEEVHRTVRRLVEDSGNPWLTGVCCINMDQDVRDEQITAILEEVETLREEHAAARG